MLVQADMLRALGAVPVVVAVADEDHAEDRWRLEGTETILVRGRGPDQLAWSGGMGCALDGARLDLLHLHGVWQHPSHAAGVWARRSGRPLVISPHGMFDPWTTRNKAWKKHLARRVWERRAWHSAAAFHALTDAEAHDIAHETGGARIAVISNAAPSPVTPPARLRPPNALYLGRIHPKKNIAALIEAWTLARPELPADATLTIAGWGDDAGIEALEKQMRGGDRSIDFVGTAFGSQKAALFDISRFCVLPSFSEGLPMVILEAWAAGTPTIMSRACHLPQGYEAGAAVECGTDAESIRRALVEGFALDEPRWLAMARAAQALAAGTFGPPTVAERWERLYAELLSPSV